MIVPDERKDQLKRIDTSALYQPFVMKLCDVLNACAARGWVYVATGGLRTWEAQDALYAKGRTAPGGIVTNARGGYSLHNFGIAVDFARDADLDRDGLQPDYRDESYRVLAEEAVREGLEAGYYWNLQGGGLRSDSPHVQWGLKKRGISPSRLRQEYARGGYTAVFDFLDGFP